MVEVKLVDYKDPNQGADLLRILDTYALDIMGGGEPLDPKAREHLIPRLRETSFACSFLAYVDGEAMGMANCFFSFSTFAARPLLNIHDFAVAPEARGKGLAKAMLETIQAHAEAHDCCKLTLEVLENNHRAQHVYVKFGFEGYELTEESGKALFWQKKLT